MPELLVVQDNTLLEDLTTDFQLQLTPKVPAWWISDTIVPVALVSSSVTLSALLAKNVENAASEGPQNAAAANAVLADTGQLAAGKWHFRIYIDQLEVTNNYQIEVLHRNATDTATLLEHRISMHSGLGAKSDFLEFSLQIAQNERIRVENDATGHLASSTLTAIIFSSTFT